MDWGSIILLFNSATGMDQVHRVVMLGIALFSAAPWS
jgi:hypothetical protein